MKDGSSKEVEGTEIIPDYAYDKREILSNTIINARGEKVVKKTTTNILTHIPTGAMITSADKINTLKLICSEPEFFEEFDPQKIIKALHRFWNRYDWKEPKASK